MRSAWILGFVGVAVLVLPRDAAACTLPPACGAIHAPADGTLPRGGSLFISCRNVRPDQIEGTVARSDGTPVAFELRAWDEVIEVALEPLPEATRIRADLAVRDGPVTRLTHEAVIGSADTTRPILTGASVGYGVSVSACDTSLDRTVVDLANVSPSEEIATWALKRPGDEAILSAVATHSEEPRLLGPEDLECYDVIAFDFGGNRSRLPTACVEGCACGASSLGGAVPTSVLLVVALVLVRSLRKAR